MNKILHSPFLHFILIGMALFFLYEKFKPQSRELITVTSQTIDALVQQQEELQQMPVSEEQREQIIQNHIEDEILLKVAYDRGLDKNDFRVRQRILSLVRSSLTEIIPEPTYTQLQAFYKENRAEYLSDTSWSFQQVYFNFNSEKLPEDPDIFLAQISKKENPDELGDFTAMGGPRTKVSFNELARSYGKDFASQVSGAPQNIWIGPIESISGIHYLKIYAQHHPELPSFKQMENYLRQDYIFRKTLELQENKIRELSSQFEIEVEGAKIKL